MYGIDRDSCIHRTLSVIVTAYYLSLFPTDLRTGRLVVTAPSSGHQ